MANIMNDLPTQMQNPSEETVFPQRFCLDSPHKAEPSDQECRTGNHCNTSGDHHLRHFAEHKLTYRIVFIVGWCPEDRPQAGQKINSCHPHSHNKCCGYLGLPVIKPYQMQFIVSAISSRCDRQPYQHCHKQEEGEHSAQNQHANLRRIFFKRHILRLEFIRNRKCSIHAHCKDKVFRWSRALHMIPPG